MKGIEEASGLPEGTILQAFVFVCEFRWRGIRTEAQCRKSAGALCRFLADRGRKDLDDITTEDLAAYVRLLRSRGVATKTIRRYLSVLTTIGRAAVNHSPPLASRMPPVITLANQSKPQWWLTPDNGVKLVAYLREDVGVPFAVVLADYIEFICLTGLRVEEALRLKRGDFLGLGTDTPQMVVPGTKTTGSRATIPIAKEAAQIAARRLAENEKLFPVHYTALSAMWRELCKPFLGEPVSSCTATLRSLRRSFGRYATDRGMPTETLQNLYRHKHIGTTVGYLKLIGASDLEKARRWL